MTAYFVITSESPPGELIEREVARVQKVIEKYPNDPDRRVELALLYFEAGSHQQAIAQLKTALELNEYHQGALMTLGDAYMKLERYEKAVEPYSKVVELNKDNPMRGVSRQLEGVYYYLGTAYFNLRRLDEAIQSFQEALSIDATDADAWYMLGATYQHFEDFEKAIESYKEAIRFVPNFKEAYLGMAQCYEETGQSLFATYANAMVSYSSGSSGEAIRQLQSVIATKPDFAEAYLGLGLAYEKEGEIDKAIDAYTDALHLEPEMWLVQARLQMLLASQE